MILLIAVLCCVALSFNGLAAQTKASAMTPAAQSTQATAAPTLLSADSKTNLSQMNATFYSPMTFGIAQAVKFTPPKPGWKLEGVLIVGTDGWNSSNKEFPVQGIFGLEIRDAKLRLLYQYADTQLEFFTSQIGSRTAMIEIPALSMDGDFYVCFYGRDIVRTLTELQNATGNSYYYIRDTGQLLPGALPLANNQSLPVNWIIRSIGE
jgi:hypothetical protein